MKRFIVLMILLLTAFAAAAAQDEAMLKMGVLAYRPKPQTLTQWQPVAAYLEKSLGRRVELAVYDHAELTDAAARRAVDVVFTTPNHFILLQHTTGVSAPLATLLTREGAQELSGYGGAIIARTERADIRSLADLAGKRIAVVSTDAFGGFQIQAAELVEAGLPTPAGDQLSVTGQPHDRVVEAILDGRADAGFLRTGVIEAMVQEGKLDLRRIKIINRQRLPAFPYAASTKLYPEWPVAVMPQVDERTASRLAAALFLLPRNELSGVAGFTTPANYAGVENLLRRLRLPPFEQAPDIKLRDLWNRYAAWIVVLVGLMASLAAASAGLVALYRRSRQSEAVLQEREQALRDGRQRMDNIIANSPGAIYRCADSPEWTMEFISAAINRITGYPAEDFLNNRVRSYASIIHPDDRPAVREAVSAGLEHKDRYEMDYRLVSTDGTPRWVHEQGRGVFAEDGRLICLDGVIFDVTDQKRAEEEIRKLNQELEQRVAERTAQLETANKELEAFAYSVSHDLRAPLRHIDGFLGLLKDSMATALDEQSRHYMETISVATKRMGALIDDLLSFSRMGRQRLTRAQVDLGTLVQDVIHEFEPETKGRAIHWQVTELPVVTGDRAMLRVVLSNLISNALKFTRPREQAEIAIGSLPDQATDTVIFVRDNGVGFDMQYADKLFGVFERLHGVEEFEGTGIGLANVRRVVSRHGGKAWAEGRVDGGAAFYFSLPRSPNDDRGMN